eukprot:6462833-Amphidinium_carterae.1
MDVPVCVKLGLGSSCSLKTLLCYLPKHSQEHSFKPIVLLSCCALLWLPVVLPYIRGVSPLFAALQCRADRASEAADCRRRIVCGAIASLGHQQDSSQSPST